MYPNFGHLPYLAYGLGFEGVGVQVQKDKPALEDQNMGCRLKIKATYVYTYLCLMASSLDCPSGSILQ